MADGRLGLIDYGQCKRITPAERFAIAKFVVAVADRRPPHEVAEALRGFATTCHCNRHCNHRDHAAHDICSARWSLRTAFLAVLRTLVHPLG